MNLWDSRFWLKIARPVSIWATAGALFGLSGCSHAVLEYRLEGRGPDQVLIPPRTVWSAEAPAIDVTIERARKKATATADCNIQGGPISLTWQGRGARVALRLQQIEANGQQGVASGRIYADPLRGIDLFRHSLAELESFGCLQSDEDYALRRNLTQRLPLPPSMAYRLLFGSFELTGSFDLTSDFRLAVTSPVFEGAEARLAGRETTYYSFIRVGSEDHVRMSLSSFVESALSGVPVKESSPQNRFPLSASAGYWRLLFKSEQAGETSITRAIVVNSGTKLALDQAQEQIQARHSDFCAPVTGAKVDCYAFPANSAVNAEMRVIANGKPVYVQAAYATLGEIVDDPIRPSLRIRRLFQGRLIPVRISSDENVGEMQLMPGDRISW
jgi:hypothetical protein